MITLTNPNTGAIKKATTGYSWWTFWFGFLCPLFRGDLKWSGIFFVAAVFISLILNGNPVATACGPIFGFFYNKLYIKDLINKGWLPVTDQDRTWLIQNEVISNNN